MQNGMLPIALSQEECVELAKDAEAGLELEVDLEKEEIRRTNGRPPIPFSTDPFRRHCLLNGLDDIALTMQRDQAITSFETKRSKLWPWLDGLGYEGKIPIVPSRQGKQTEW
jgi:3-isopropylmalate dehydratase